MTNLDKLFPFMEGEYHPEYDGYPKGAKGSKVKQADTVMLSFPFGVEMPQETLSNDLTWYEPNTDANGPAMTWAIFAIGWFNTGNYTHAQSRFQRGFSNNVNPPYMVWTEIIGGRGCTPFLTGAGGFLQSITFGTSGLRIESDQLVFNPPPPSATGGSATSISMTFNYLGAVLKQTVMEEEVTYELVSQTKASFVLVTAQQKQDLKVGSPITISARGKVAIAPVT